MKWSSLLHLGAVPGLAIQLRSGTRWGPKHCVSVTLSEKGSCVLETRCKGLDISNVEFSFVCKNQKGAKKHNFGVGGFDDEEEFDTGIRCDTCGLPAFFQADAAPAKGKGKGKGNGKSGKGPSPNMPPAMKGAGKGGDPNAGMPMPPTAAPKGMGKQSAPATGAAPVATAPPKGMGKGADPNAMMGGDPNMPPPPPKGMGKGNDPNAMMGGAPTVMPPPPKGKGKSMMWGGAPIAPPVVDHGEFTNIPEPAMPMPLPELPASPGLEKNLEEHYVPVGPADMVDAHTVNFGPAGCVSTYEKEGFCHLKTSCSAVPKKEFEGYNIGFICTPPSPLSPMCTTRTTATECTNATYVDGKSTHGLCVWDEAQKMCHGPDEIAEPIRHFFGKNSFAAEEEFNTNIQCSVCDGLDSFSEDADLEEQVMNLKQGFQDALYEMKHMQQAGAEMWHELEELREEKKQAAAKAAAVANTQVKKEKPTMVDAKELMKEMTKMLQAKKSEESSEESLGQVVKNAEAEEEQESADEYDDAAFHGKPFPAEEHEVDEEQESQE